MAAANSTTRYFFQFGLSDSRSDAAPENRQVMPDDHSELVPPLPIPNRTVKRLSADDSAATSVKVGHRQAVIPENPRRRKVPGVFALARANTAIARKRDSSTVSAR